MKTLYLIGGTMGAGKTATCRSLKNMLPDSVMLDGDWCWDMHPFQVTEETKAMVMGNICYLLNSFLRCSAIKNIIFCWVMHQQSIIDEILSKLELTDCAVKSISLLCGAGPLEQRLRLDVEAGIREPDVIDRSLARIPLYSELDTIKVDVSNITAEQAAQRICSL